MKYSTIIISILILRGFIYAQMDFDSLHILANGKHYDSIAVSTIDDIILSAKAKLKNDTTWIDIMVKWSASNNFPGVATFPFNQANSFLFGLTDSFNFVEIKIEYNNLYDSLKLYYDIIRANIIKQYVIIQYSKANKSYENINDLLGRNIKAIKSTGIFINRSKNIKCISIRR